MKWIILAAATVMLSACGFYNTRAIEYRQVLVPQPYSRTVSVVYDNPVDTVDTVVYDDPVNVTDVTIDDY